MANKKHQKNSDELLDKNGEDIRIYDTNGSEETSENHDRLSNYFSKHNEKPEDTQTRSSIQIKLSPGKTSDSDTIQSKHQENRFSFEERNAEDQAPQRNQKNEAHNEQETTQNRTSKPPTEERQQEEIQSSGRASKAVDLRSPQADDSNVGNNDERQTQSSEQETSIAQNGSSDQQADEILETVIRGSTEEQNTNEEPSEQETEIETAAEEVAAKEAKERPLRKKLLRSKQKKKPPLKRLLLRKRKKQK